MLRIILFTVTVWLLFISTVLAQDAVPSEILRRTFFIKVGNMTGTAFTIDHGGKVYLVTARHLVSGLPERSPTIQIRRADQWEDYHTLKTLFPSSNEVDIGVLETGEKVSQPYEIPTMGDSDAVTMGQQVWFLGYPFEGLGSRMNDGTLIPFMKRGTMSALVGTNPDAVVLFIDGFNNPGFSGGPIVFWSFAKHKIEIIGVVQGYRTDTAKTLINGVQVDTPILVNSGILVGYSIKHALQAIEREEERRP